MSKYGNIKTRYGDRLYDSKREAEYAMRLDLRQHAGEIETWEPQPRFSLHATNGVKVCAYVGDFLVTYPGGRREVIDVKGVQTPVFRLKAKLFAAEYPSLPLVIVQ